MPVGVSPSVMKLSQFPAPPRMLSIVPNEGWERHALASAFGRPFVPPSPNMPEATELAHRFARKIDGMALSGITETLFNIPTTAHILGGCCMGDGPDTGVIDRDHRVFGYDGLYVVDGSAVSANPGVNPSLAIVLHPA